MNDRLLTPDEICETCPAIAMRTCDRDNLRCCPDDCLVHPNLTRTAKAQLTKDNAWWVKTLELNCGDGHDKPLIQIGVQEWQDFKKEIGI